MLIYRKSMMNRFELWNVMYNFGIEVLLMNAIRETCLFLLYSSEIFVCLKNMCGKTTKRVKDE